MARRILRFLQLGGRLGIPLLFLVAFGLMTYDQFHPWSLANELAPDCAGQTRLLVGAGYRNKPTYAVAGSVAERTAHYIYYPEVLQTKEMHELLSRSGEKPSVSTAAFSFPLNLGVLVLAVVLSVFSWYMPLIKRA
jgi:hypothetical protein